MWMPTDDEIFRVRLVYLGPPGYTLPVQLTYAQLGTGVLLAGGMAAAGWIIFGSLMVIGPAIAAAMFLTYLLFQYVDFDVPARKVVKAFLRDSRRLGPAGTPQRVPTPTGRHIIWRDTITEGDQ
jgi:hypothetical protein